MKNLHINIELDWDNVITHYPTGSNTSSIEDEKRIIDEYGPPMDLYSNFRDNIENCKLLSDQSSMQFEILKFLKFNSTDFIDNTNFDNVEKEIAIRKAINILKFSWKHSTSFENFTLSNDSTSNARPKKPISFLKFLTMHDYYVKINIGRRNVKLYEIISDNNVYEQYLNWWCQFDQ